MTDQQRVKLRYPDVYLAGSYSMISGDDHYDVIVRSTGKCIGSGNSGRKAYKDAASCLSDGVDIDDHPELHCEASSNTVKQAP
jgi:hypothetical protein